MKKSKIFLSLFLILVIVVVSTISYGAVDTTDNARSKISDELYDIIKTGKSEAVPVYIFLKDCDKSKLSDDICKAGYNVDFYENKNLYYKYILPELMIEGERVKDLVDEQYLTPQQLNLCNKDSSIDIKLRQKINQARLKNQKEYKHVYRRSISNIIEKYVKNFVAEIDKSIIKLLYQGEYAEFIVAQVKADDINKIAKNHMVESIAVFKDREFKELSWSSTSITTSDDINGLGSSFYNDGDGYDGTGVTIGVVELGKCDEANCNLTDADITYYPTPYVDQSEVTVNDHATKVISLICGKKTTISGKKYGGAATGATVYYTAAHRESYLYQSIKLFCDLDVDIINMCIGGYTASTSYDPFENLVDKVLFNSRVSFVFASGNNSNPRAVTLPGKAYNAITVGSIECKPRLDPLNPTTNINYMLTPPYAVSYFSSAAEDSYLANKPDVVAPGRSIYLPVSETKAEYIDSGTSFAAPIVTGALAQIMQESFCAINNPNAAKNYMICGADNDDITGTTVSYGQLTDESGAGLINAVKSFEIVDNGTELMGMYSYNSPNSTEYKTNSPRIYLQKGQRIRIVLTFEKEEEINLPAAYGNNIDLLLKQDNQYSSYTVTSTSTNNNVEIIDTHVPYKGYYRIYTRLTNSILDVNNNPDLHYWISWRIE